MSSTEVDLFYKDTNTRVVGDSTFTMRRQHTECGTISVTLNVHNWFREPKLCGSLIDNNFGSLTVADWREC